MESDSITLTQIKLHQLQVTVQQKYFSTYIILSLQNILYNKALPRKAQNFHYLHQHTRCATINIITTKESLMTKERKIDTLLTFIMIAGAAFAVAFLLRDIDGSRQVTKASAALTLEHVDRETIQQNQLAEVSYDWSDIRQVSAENIEAALAEVNYYDLPVIGAIAIPGVNINLPIINGVSDAGMFTGASTLSPDAKMGHGNFALASHRSRHKDVLFGALPDITAGMKIYLSDLEHVYEYEGESNEVLEPTRMDVLDYTEHPSITLITCTLDSQRRIIVKANLTEVYSLTDAPQEALDTLSVSPENGYHNQYR